MFDLSFFKQEGFQVIRNVIPVDVIDALYAFLNKEKEKGEEHLKVQLRTDQLVEKLNELKKNQEALATYPKELQMLFSGHFSLQTRLDPLLQAIPRLPQVREIFNQIFPNENPFLHLPPTARFVLPGNTFAAVPPHQDVSYNEQMEEFFVMWVPLCEIDDSRGGVQIFKGTNQPVQYTVTNTQGFWLSGIEVKAEKVHFPMKKGDILLLNKWIVHSSMPNNSTSARISVDYRLFYGNSKKHSLDIVNNKVLNPQV